MAGVAANLGDWYNGAMGESWQETDILQVTTTTGTRDVAERIAAELVDLRLAACVQVSGPVVSTFRWQGAIENAEEWRCTAKTTRRHLAAIGDVLTRLHPYELPELVATPIVGGSDAYLKWLVEQLESER
jgi:periplasmic divalent cation tolerance protein